MTRSLRIFRALFFVVLVGLSSRSFAQSGTLSGTVTDSAGAVVSGAKVAAENNATNAAREATTNDRGSYSIADLQPGTYTVTVRKDGFAASVFRGVQITVAQTLPLDAKLEVGSATVSVDVSGTSEAPIETDSSQLSTIVDAKTIETLPLITRDPYSLVLLSPGTVMATSSLGGFSVNGARERNNNFLLDGVDNNDTSVPGIPSGISSTNPDAVSEYRVITNNFAAQYGRNTGAIVNVITRGGSNQFHGDVYWFGRYNALGARDWFNGKVDGNGDPQRQNPYVRNIFGGSIGGPVWKDRTFFFFNTDIQRFRTTNTVTTIVPTAAFKSGIFTYQGSQVNLTDPNSPGNINHLTLDPKIQAALALFPSPNAGLIDDVRGNYQFPGSSQADQNVFTVRGDHKIVDGENLTVRYVYNKFSDPNPGFSDLIPGLGSYNTAQRAHNGMIQLNSVFGTSLTNQLAGAYNQTDDGFFCNGTSTFDKITGTDSIGFGQDFVLPGLFTFGCGVLGDSNGQDRLTGTLMFVDALTKVKGNHTMTFGGEYRHVREDGYDGFGTRTTNSFDVFTNNQVPAYDTPTVDPSSAGYTTIQDLIYTLSGSVQQQSNTQNFDKDGSRTPLDFRRYRQNEFAVYAQDSWKILPKLTLNYGLRYEFYGVPYEVDNNFSQLFTPSNQVLTSDDSMTFTIVGPGTHHQLYSNNSKLFQPRLGFAYDLFGNGKVAIRGGYGMFNDRIFGNLFGNSRSNPPFQQQPTALLNGSTTVSNLAFLPVSTPSATLPAYSFASVSLIDSKLKQQASQNWNLGFEAEIFKDVVLETNYVGAHGLHILRALDGNAPDPGRTAAAVAYCQNPANDAGCVDTPTQSTLQGTLAWFANTFGGIPVPDQAGNTILFEPALNTAIASSSYNALQTTVTKRFTHGFNLRGTYTWAHGLDNAGDPLAPGGQQRSFPRNSNRLDLEHGNSDADVTSRAVIDGTWELPIGTGKANFSSGFVGKVFEGISLSGIGSFQTGQPIDIFGNRDSQHQGLSGRVNLTGNPYPTNQGPSIIADGTGKRTGPALSAFSLTPFDTVPTVGRNTFRGPNFNNIDAVFQKDTGFEKFHVLLRVESYNILNHPQFALPQASFADPGTFGISTSTVLRSDGTTAARQIQAALKLVF